MKQTKTIKLESFSTKYRYVCCTLLGSALEVEVSLDPVEVQIMVFFLILNTTRIPYLCIVDIWYNPKAVTIHIVVKKR